MKSKLRMEGLTLTVKSVKRSIQYYKKIGFLCAWDASPHFALVKLDGASVGLLAWSEAKKEGALKTTAKHNRSIHVELSTDDLDGLYEKLKKRAFVSRRNPMTNLGSDRRPPTIRTGIRWNSHKGGAAKNLKQNKF